MRTIAIVVLMINSVNSFLSISLYKPLGLSRRTAMKLNYLDNIGGNHSVPHKLVAQPLYNKPIPIITFDDVFLKLNSISQVFMSSNSDRVILCYGDKKGVYYMNGKKDLKKMEFILSLIQADIKIIIDYPTHMDMQSGTLYCSPRVTKFQKNMTNDEIEDIINDVINKYEDEVSDEEDEEDEDYGYDEGDFDFY